MAKVSAKNRTKKRLEMIERFAEKRAMLKKEGNVEALDALPKNASPSRKENRCFNCGRPRGFIRKFGLCRICFRELANAGHIPGVKKSSW